ncbi:hypothetical protein CHS0354_032007 [Potamilus streckersoni]|uniref:Uncharacterized protein n=1 Tax=Potamilus streckersoni TaxID=2493646 RepID=A0AAE0TMK1_9BIVA|nr:hypothetical protein CHS0354_032007 [Potamilus streckersoni]
MAIKTYALITERHFETVVKQMVLSFSMLFQAGEKIRADYRQNVPWSAGASGREQMGKKFSITSQAGDKTRSGSSQEVPFQAGQKYAKKKINRLKIEEFAFTNT